MEDVSWSILFALPRPVLNFSYWRDAFCKGGNEPHSDMEIRFHLDLAKKNIYSGVETSGKCMHGGNDFFVHEISILRISSLHLGSMDVTSQGGFILTNFAM